MARKKSDRPPLVTPSHGSGKLYAGGVPGNRGGSGAPPSELRARLRGTVEDRVKIIEQILDDPDTSTSDRIRCVDLLLKYGLGTAHEVSGTDGSPILLAADVEKAAQEVRKKLKALAAHARRLPASERLDRKPAIPGPPKPPKKYGPEEITAVFEDRGQGIKTQEPPEIAEAVAESATEPEPTPQRTGRPPAGRLSSSGREPLRSRFL